MNRAYDASDIAAHPMMTDEFKGHPRTTLRGDDVVALANRRDGTEYEVARIVGGRQRYLAIHSRWEKPGEIHGDGWGPND